MTSTLPHLCSSLSTYAPIVRALRSSSSSVSCAARGAVWHHGTVRAPWRTMGRMARGAWRGTHGAGRTARGAGRIARTHRHHHPLGREVEHDALVRTSCTILAVWEAVDVQATVGRRGRNGHSRKRGHVKEHDPIKAKGEVPVDPKPANAPRARQAASATHVRVHALLACRGP